MSVALSVFYLAGGELTKSSLFFGVVSFTKPSLIMVLAWGALFYFLWRYWIHLKPIRELMRLTTNNNPYYSDAKHHLCVFQKEIGENESYRKFARSLLDKEVRGLEDPKALFVRGFFKRKIDFSYVSLGDGQLYSGYPVVSVSYIKVFPFEIRAQFRSMCRYPSFSDYVLPYYIFFLPFIIVGYKRFL